MPAWMPRAVVLGAVALAGCGSRAPAGTREQPPSDVTFNDDVAPVIYRNCASCHRPGQIAPFSLLTYADVKQHAGQIAAMTKARVIRLAPERDRGVQESTPTLRHQIDLIQRWLKRRGGVPRTLPTRERT